MLAQKLPLILLLCSPIVYSPASQPLLGCESVAKETTNQEAEQVVTHFHTKPVSLEQLTKEADRIFIGQVTEVCVQDETLGQGEDKVTLPVRKITFLIKQVLKGKKILPSCLYTVRLYEPISSPIRQGELVLLYLSPDSALGLTQPIGIHSGHFIVSRQSDPNNPDHLASTYDAAINLKSNHGLWKDYLWDKAVTPVKFIQRLKELKTSTYVANEIIKSAVSPPKPAPIPLDLFRAATTCYLTKPT